MPSILPRSLFSGNRSSFAVIDPKTEKFHRRLDHGYLFPHVAISYMWDEWKQDKTDRLPDWSVLRPRLMGLVGDGALPGLKQMTENAKSCWIDCKCIDQSNDADKAYWVPRMDQIYAESQVTILMLRHLDLTPILELCRQARCGLGSKAEVKWNTVEPHSCLSTQSCTKLPDMSPERMRECLQSLHGFAEARFRKRAWIQQEILMSGTNGYLVSWETGWMRLADIGVMAGALYERNPHLEWLLEFRDWFRRLFWLTQCYSIKGFSVRGSDIANVLQMGADLEATVPADKFYALCGIMRLKTVQYNRDHSPNEAFQAIVAELTAQKRMSWFYALRPPPGTGPIEIDSTQMPPFTVSRAPRASEPRAVEATMGTSTIDVDATPVGTIVWTQSLREYFHGAFALTDPSSIPSWSLAAAPAIIRRIAVDIVDPLLKPLIAEVVFEALGLKNNPMSIWEAIPMIVKHHLEQSLNNSNASWYEDLAQRIIHFTGSSIMKRVEKLQDEYSVIGWTEEGSSQTPFVMLALKEASVGDSLYHVTGDQTLLFAVQIDSGASSSEPTYSFRGMMLQLDVTADSAELPEAQTWKKKRSKEDSEILSFPYRLGTR